MKSILLSIRPEWVARILNGEKTREIRRTAPKEWVDYLSGKTKVKPKPMTGYIYCTKTIKPFSDYDWGEFTFDDLPKLGKVVACFTLREVEKIIALSKEEKPIPYYATGMDLGDTLRKATLSEESLREYLKDKDGYAWHISDLQIFDKPKELDQFEYLNPSGTRNIGQRELNGNKSKKHPPQSWCFVEIKCGE